MSAPKHLSKSLTWLLALLSPVAAVTMSGQTVPDPISRGVAAPKDEYPERSTSDGDVVVLSLFEVNAEEDAGYQAANTTSGSRMNTALKDTAAPISAFTPEFLADFGVTGLGDMMSYAANSESEFEDATNGFNNAGARSAGGNDASFRLRGLVAGASVDYASSSIPVDFYNIDRAEVTSGPNSVLFGLGDAGGNVALTTKRANLKKNKHSFSNVVGSWEYERATFDSNVVVIPGVLALRVMGLYQDSESWRKWVFDEQHRATGSLTFQPFKKTIIRGSLERGQRTNSTVVNWNAQDNFTAWLATGSSPFDLAFPGAAPAGTTRFNNNQRYTFIENDNKVYNFRREFQSASIYGAGVQTLSPFDLDPLDINPMGPSAVRTQNFNNGTVAIEQRIGEFTFELSYFHNENYINASTTDGQPNLFIDPNLSVASVTDDNATVNSGHGGGMYLEQRWGHSTIQEVNDIVRLTGAREIDLGKWFGRHRIAGLFEHSEKDRTQRNLTEIFVDDSNRAITVPTTPEGPQNAVFRRNYVTAGDFTTYYTGNILIPVPDITVGGTTYHSREVSKAQANDHILQSINSYMLAAQSYWWNNRLTTTLGYRIDELEFRPELEAQITDPNDPRILSGEKVYYEWANTGVYEEHRYSPFTFTAGSVFHATNRISFFANTSTNRSSPRFARMVLPTGEIPPPTEGESTDFGFMIDFFGDDRVFMRVTHFDTKQLNDASIVPDGTNVTTSNQLGGDNLVNIADMLNAAGFADIRPVYYNAGMADVFSKGFEVEMVANPTRNISLRLAYSHTNRNRENVFGEIFEYYATNSPEWLALAASSSDPSLSDNINGELNLIYQKLDEQLALQSGPLGSRPDKVNLTGRYQFRDGWLQGVTAGGGIRYQSPQYMSYDLASNTTEKGNETLFGDVFLSYKRKSPWWKGSMVFQLNVRNITNDYLVEIGRRNTTGDGIRRVYLNEPRNIRFTATFNF